VNSGETTWHGFAVAIASRLRAEVEVLRATSDEVRRPASRPAYSVLDTTRLSGILGRRMPTWQDALGRYLEVPCES